MDFATIGGLILCWASLAISVGLEGGELGGFLNEAAAILVFGGTFGATATGFSMQEIKELPAKLGRCFMRKKADRHAMIRQLVEFATKSRRDGVLSLEDSIESVQNEFMRKGLQLLVDGVDLDRIQATLETDIDTLKTWYKEGQEFLQNLGGFSPTLGIIGTVLGLINMLSKLDDPGTMGPSIAAAFIATMYGVSAANLLYLPLANKMKNAAAGEVLDRKIILDGLLCIQAGTSPRLIEQMLMSYMLEGSKAEKGGAAAK